MTRSNAVGQYNSNSRKVIEPNVIAHWSWLRDNPWISPDGQYAAWIVGKIGADTLTIAATNDSWQEKFAVKNVGTFPSFFSADSRYYFFPFQEKWCKFDLVSRRKLFFGNPRKLIQQNGKWLVWQQDETTDVKIENLLKGTVKHLQPLKDFGFDRSGLWLTGRAGKAKDSLLLYDLLNDKLYSFSGVKSYHIKEGGSVMLLHQTIINGSKLIYINLVNNKQQEVFTANKETDLIGYCINNSGNAVGFTIKEANNSTDPVSHWFYSVGVGTAVKLQFDSNSLLRNKMISGTGLRFSMDGQHLLFPLILEETMVSKKTVTVQVDVWSYSDKLLYSGQSESYTGNLPEYTAVASVADGKINVVPTIRFESSIKDIGGDYALVSKNQVGDRFWEYESDSVWLVPLKGGPWKLLPYEKVGFLEFSQDGNSVICFDQKRGRHFYKYDIFSGKEQKLSAAVPDWTLGVNNRNYVGRTETDKFVNLVVAARLNQARQILVYDDFDLWQIDLNGKVPAKNLTNGYGRKQQIVFRVAQSDYESINDSDSLLLTAFAEPTKANGFYRITKGNPDCLYMGSYFFSHSREIVGNLQTDPYGTGMLPVKATGTNSWIVRRESATEAPNYFFTKDFKTYLPLTHLEPQKQYNWYTTELVNFTQADGQPNQGVLFKPRDFDPKKKYPVLYYCYEQYSMLLNRFIDASVSEAGKPNIPWYVSRGYLVFTPDHYFRNGIHRGKSTLLAAEAAIEELSKLPYVNMDRIGIMGLSQGGGFTNYIVTHSKLFAAAFEGCGVSNTVSASLQLGGIGHKGGSRLEGSEQKMGSNMWDNPEQWIDESAVLNAHRVSTPLLIMHNKKDGAVLFEQGIEMFTALRRLDKKVWMLQYDQGSHGVIGKEAIDLTTRVNQFFDHFLKGLPPPKWMTKGIPYGLKGIESGLELDMEGKLQ